jgi:hypothetical protein
MIYIILVLEKVINITALVLDFAGGIGANTRKLYIKILKRFNMCD